jgi:hypothetical protein
MAGQFFWVLIVSEKWPANLDGTHLPNFHTRGHAGDRRLKRFVQDAQLDNLIGGFMTDLSEEICSRSDKVKDRHRGSDDFAREKIDLIGREEKRAVIAFGDKTFESLRKGLGMKNSAVVEHKDHRTAKFDANLRTNSGRYIASASGQLRPVSRKSGETASTAIALI